MTTVALYARVSSRKQEQNNTIESQVVELERRIATDGHKLLSENKFKDNGFSGWNLKREGLDELRDKVGEGQVDKIYIHSPDRLSRKSSHQMILLEEFEKEGAEVIFLNYKTENNPESKLLLGVQGLISEYECAKIMERSRRGKLHSARKGCVSVMGNAPYGYRYIKHVDREKAKFEIDEEEAEVVRKLFEWVGQERVSLKETARRLKERCITTPKGRRNWHPGTVCRILRNPAYKGQAAFGKTNVGPIKKEMRAVWKVRKKSYSIYQTEKKNWIHIEIPNIVEEELFDIVQEQLSENRKRARMQRSGRKYLLQGLMVCQCCKYTYYGMSNVKGGRSYYRCPGTDANRFGGNRVCSSKSIRADILEEVVWEEVKMVLKEPEAMTKVRLLKYENKQTNDELEKRADKIEQGIERLAYVYARGHITKEKYDAEVEAMEKELKGIRDQKEEVSDEKRLKKELDFITSSIENLSSEIESELNQADHETKLDIIRKLVQRIEIDDDNVHIVFRLKELALERQKKSVQHCIRIPVSRAGMTEEVADMANRLQEISLTAKCDRVEYLPNEQVAIIDYKLGSPPSNEEVMSGFFPQLILQGLAVEYITKKEVSELAYWKLDYDKIKVISIQSYRYKMQEFKNDLPGFLSHYLSNSTPFIASPYFDKFLRFNSYKQLERIGEWL